MRFLFFIILLVYLSSCRNGLKTCGTIVDKGIDPVNRFYFYVRVDNIATSVLVRKSVYDSHEVNSSYCW